ncbi:RNA demethylase ALKBH10B [Linum grandiflorum]
MAPPMADPAPPPAVLPSVLHTTMMTTTPDAAFAKDAILAWFRGEFAAANAIIDALCQHLAELSNKGGGDDRSDDYEPVFSAIHRRRLNWIPVLRMQKYHSVADVAAEVRRVTERKVLERKEENKANVAAKEEEDEKQDENCEAVAEEVEVADYSPDGSDHGTDSGASQSQEVQANSDDTTIDICSNHQECNHRPTLFNLTKGFSAKEHVKGHMVNVVKGLKLFEQVFTDSELSKLTHFVDELRLAGQKGELSGDTFILFNKQMKGNKRELIQFGVPIFEHIKEDASNQTCNIEPIPALLEGVINHLVQWRLIPEYRRPNGCIIHFFDEEEFSQPFQKPPHVEQPVATLLLSESTMAFGRNIAGDSEGNYRGSLVLSLKQGSLLVMRGNSAEMARHVMCPSQNKRVSITFFRVREEPIQTQSPPTSPMHGGALTVWQPATLINNGYGGSSLINNGFGGVGTMANWGHLIRTPFVMVAAPPMAQPQLMVSPKKIMPPLAQGGGGTGVFLPWARMGSRRPPKHLPPRAQRSRYLALPSGRRTANPTSSEGEKST